MSITINNAWRVAWPYCHEVLAILNLLNHINYHLEKLSIITIQDHEIREHITGEEKNGTTAV